MLLFNKDMTVSIITRSQQSFLVPQTIYFTHGIRSNKCFKSFLTHEINQSRKFFFCQHDFQLYLPLVGVAPNHFVQGHTTTNGMNDKIHYFLVVFGDDIHTSLRIDVRHEMIQNQTIEPGSN